MTTEEKIAMLMEQTKWQNAALVDLKINLKEVSIAVQSLRDFKWQVIGFAMCGSGLVTLLIEVAKGASK